MFTECYIGTYGDECGETCSEHCAGDQDSCHHVNGTCDLGCDPGYQGSNCTQGELVTKQNVDRNLCYALSDMTRTLRYTL